MIRFLSLSVLLLAALLGDRHPAYAEDQPAADAEQEEKPLVEFESRLGYPYLLPRGGQTGYRPDRWVPLQVEGINRTEDDPERGLEAMTVEGSFVYEQSVRHPRNPAFRMTWRYEREFTLPPHSRKRYTMHVYPYSNARGAFSIDGRADKDLRQRPADDSQRLLLVISDHAEANYGFLRQQMRSADQHRWDRAARPDLEGLLPAVIKPGAMPDVWIDYTTCDAVLIDGPPSGAMSPAQAQALRGYVESGGHLIVTSGRSLSRLREFGLLDVLGLNFTGALERRTELPALRVCGGRIGGEEDPLAIPVVDPQPGTAVLLGEPDLPLVVRRRLGLGRVTFCGLHLQDYELSRWAGRAPLVEWMLGRSDPPALVRQGGPDSLRQQISADLSETSVVKPPPRGWVSVYLVLYLLLLVPANYLFFRWRNRQEYAWAVVPVLAVVFAGYAWFAGVVGQRGTLTTSQLGVVVAGPGATHGRSTTFMSLNSPVETYYDVSTPGVRAFFNHLEMPARAPGQNTFRMHIVETDDRMEIRDFKVESRSLSRLEAQALVPLSGMQVPLSQTLVWDEGRFAWEVHNPTDAPLLGCVAWWRNGARYVGDLEPGESRVLDVTRYADLERVNPEAVLRRSIERLRDHFPEADAEGNFVARVAGSAVYNLFDALPPDLARQPLLLGWAPNALLDVHIDGRPCGNIGATLYVLQADEQRASSRLKQAPDYSVRLDDPHLTEHSWNQQGFKAPWDAEFRGGTTPGILPLVAAPRKDVENLLARRLAVQLRGLDFNHTGRQPLPGPNARGVVHLEVYDRLEGKWTRQGKVVTQPVHAGPVDPPAVTFDGALRYVNPASGRIRMQLIFEAVDANNVPLRAQVEDVVVQVELQQ